MLWGWFGVDSGMIFLWFWDALGMIGGWFGHDLGMIWGRFGDDFGMISGWFGDDLGMIFRWFWGDKPMILGWFSMIFRQKTIPSPTRISVFGPTAKPKLPRTCTRTARAPGAFWTVILGGGKESPSFFRFRKGNERAESSPAMTKQYPPGDFVIIKLNWIQLRLSF